MAKIKLVEGGFSLIPEGTTTFKIVGVEYKEDFGKMSVEMQTKSGQKHYERFSLIKANGEVNEGALKAFSYFAKTALNNFNLDEIDEEDLVGCYITVTVIHKPYESTNDEGVTKKGTSVKLDNYTVAVGFGSDAPSEEPVEADDDDTDLDDFLDD